MRSSAKAGHKLNLKSPSAGNKIRGLWKTAKAKKKSEEVSLTALVKGRSKNRETARTELRALYLMDSASAMNDALRRSLDVDEFSSACSSCWKT